MRMMNGFLCCFDEYTEAQASEGEEYFIKMDLLLVLTQTPVI